MHKVKAGSGRARPEKRTSTLPLPPSLQKEVLSAEDSTIVLGRLRNELVPLIKRWKEVCEEQQKYSNERKGAASEKAGENKQQVASVEGGGIKGQEDVEGLRKQPHTSGRKRSRQSAGETNAKSSTSDNLAVVGLNEVLKALERREARLLVVACQRGLYGPSPVLYEQLRSLSNVSATPTLFLDCQPVMMGKHVGQRTAIAIAVKQLRIPTGVPAAAEVEGRVKALLQYLLDIRNVPAAPAR